MTRMTKTIGEGPIFHIAALPTETFPQRVLAAHLRNTKTVLMDSGTVLDDLMNADQKKRSALYEAALERLGGPVPVEAGNVHLIHADATPDAGLPLRALQALLDDTEWKFHGLDEKAEQRLAKLNREKQARQRALETAILRLSKTNERGLVAQ